MAGKGICRVDNCVNPAQRSQLCWSHYFRRRRNGNTDGQRVMRWERQKYIQEVILKYEGDECLPWPFNRERGGGTIGFEGRRIVVSKLVCQLAHGAAPTPNHHAAHGCGNGCGGEFGACMNKQHLSWKTAKENCADKLIHGTMNRGERCGTAKLTEPQVREIRKLAGTMYLREIAALYGISRGMVGTIISRKRWAWLED